MSFEVLYVIIILCLMFVTVMENGGGETEGQVIQGTRSNCVIMVHRSY